MINVNLDDIRDAQKLDEDRAEEADKMIGKLAEDMEQTWKLHEPSFRDFF